MFHIQVGLDPDNLVLRIQNRIPIWQNRLFLLAFSIALGLHLLALALFRIPDYSLSQQHHTAIASSTTLADLNGMADSSVQASLTTDRRLQGGFPPRSSPPPPPAFHAIPILSDQLPWLPISPSNPQLFTPIHAHDPIEPLFPRLHKTHLEWFGPLAEEELLKAPCFGCRGNQAQREWLIRSLLSQLRFKPHPQGNIVKREVELTDD